MKLSVGQQLLRGAGGAYAKLARRHIAATSFITRPHHRAFTATAPRMDYKSVPVPETCYADFCLIPVGTGSASVSQEVAEVQRLLKASGLQYTMHSAGTTVEGTWDEVFKVIGQAHTLVHAKGVARVQSSMRVGTRTDKKQTPADKVNKVKEILAQDP